MRPGSRAEWVLPFLVVLVAGTAKTQGESSAHDWPQFRGIHRDGRSADTQLLKQWPPEGPPLAWRIEGLGKGFSSVAIVGNRIFTMGQRAAGQFVIALDRSTHQEIWSTRITEPWPDPQSGPRCTPTVDGEHLYITTPQGDIACLTVDAGKTVWRKRFTTDFGGTMMTEYGYSESPLVDGHQVVCSPGARDAAVVALDKLTGRVIWKSPMPAGPIGKDGSSYCSMVVSDACGIHQYVQMVGRGAVGIAAEDGRLLWNYNRMTNIHACIASPLVTGDLVFCTTAYDTGSALLDLKPTHSRERIEAKEVYFLNATEFANHHGGVVLVDGYVYGGHGQNNGIATCIELKTGKIFWKQRGPGNGSAAITYADGHLYFRYQDGVMALLEATPIAMKVTGVFKLPTHDGPSWPYPVILDGMLYLRHGDSLLGYDIRAH